MEAVIETFKPVRGYDGLYEVSDYGCVRSLNYNKTGKRNTLKNVRNQQTEYEYVCLCGYGKRKRFSVHRLVWETFVGPIPDGMEIDHINTVRNDNRLANLRVVTHKENQANPITSVRNRDAQREAGKRRSQDPQWREAHRKAHNKPVLQLDKVTCETIKRWECASDAYRELGINQGNISSCCNGKLNSAGGFKWRFA